ncbi:MAG: DNA methyltransferase [Ignisphaera sp.]
MKKPLNDLSAKEWAKFSKSWFVLQTPPKSSNAKVLHPATFPEALVADFLRFFTREGDWVLDPFLGSGTTLVVCAQMNRNGIGIEIAPHWAKLAEERIAAARANLFISTTQKVIVGDAADIDRMDIPPINFVITSPPYWCTLRTKGDMRKRQRAQRNLPTDYCDDNPKNLENYPNYEDYMRALVDIFTKVARKMVDGAYMCVVVQNIKVHGKVYPLAWDLALRLSAQPNIQLCDEKIWCLDNTPLLVYGYPYAWVSNIMHRYCLIFRKVSSKN